ncbi:hypothetical protein [Desulfomonile tiedjei]|uniref:Uncharacterized protein n=1 Tax=Desulfomonile tiedjei (strain ATCC 49306 / DSM 6799 / DCB-1) TaxID=706587 RepID=I4C368_DESTA|nr:hypothetical protein [Desulfomonile tiedjei]AFM24009.1 hypothetical protein Desti_1296 [Desulfomonile tiedjei DSM 6799]
MRREHIVTKLVESGYRFFSRPFTGSVLTAEAWASNLKNKKLVIFLYRHDTDELIDLYDLPQEEENRPEIEAFLDDFQERVFRPVCDTLPDGCTSPKHKPGSRSDRGLVEKSSL